MMSIQLNAIYSFCLVVVLCLSTKLNAYEQLGQTPSDTLGLVRVLDACHNLYKPHC